MNVKGTQPKAADPHPDGSVTQILERLGQGEQAAADDLFAAVYGELRRLAAAMLAQERAGHTLQATALVHEAYLRLVGNAQTGWEGRAHFFGAAASAIRRILVDHARSRGRDKRGGGWTRVELTDAEAPAPDNPDALDLIALDEALARLGHLDPRMARLVELRFFAGLSVGESARALGVSEATAAREWVLAKGWLHAQLSGSNPDDHLDP